MSENNTEKVAKGRKFIAYILAEVLTTMFCSILIFKMPSEHLVTLAQFYIGFQTVLTAGYIGFNVWQKKVTNGKG